MLAIDTNGLVRLIARDDPEQVSTVEFSDCLAMEIVRKAGHSPMASFDRQFAKLNGVQRLR